MKKLWIALTAALLVAVLAACVSQPPVGTVTGFDYGLEYGLSDELVAAIPEGWQLARLDQAEPAFVARRSGDTVLIVALVEQILCEDDLHLNPRYALLEASGLPGGGLAVQAVNLGAIPQHQPEQRPVLSLLKLDDAADMIQLSFNGRDDWELEVDLVFEYLTDGYVLGSAKTVRWPQADPNMLDQKEYDFKANLLSTTMITDCGDVICRDFTVQVEDGYRVRLADFHYGASLEAYEEWI